MNWIMSILFLILIFMQYYLLGYTMCKTFNYETKTSMILISGFLLTFFITFIVGFPCQLFSLSWNIYFWLQLFCFVVIDGTLIFYYLKKIIHFLKKKPRFDFKTFVIENWVCILFVFLFTLFSMANELPIYQLNYDDFYYIGKMVNLVDTPALLNEDYYNGALLANQSFDVIRCVNTYELTYSFFATLFHIGIPFFCRATMVFHNYVFFTIVYKELASFFVSKRASQFVIIPFFLFLFPQGFIQNQMWDLKFKIESYDLWQFSTAAFYGSSVVRMLSLPVMYLYSAPLIKKLNIKQLIAVAIISISFISFSTIFLLTFIVFLLVILMVYFIYQCKHTTIRKQKGLYLLSFVAVCLVLLMSMYLDNVSIINTENFQTNYAMLLDFCINWVREDLCFILGCIFVPISLFLSRKNYYSSLHWITIILWVMLYSMCFLNLLVIGSFNYSFVAYRFISSVQYLFLFFTSLVFIQVYENCFKNVVFPAAVSGAYILIILIYFFTHQIYLVANVYLGSGMIKEGWDFSRVLSLDNTMSLSIFDQVGDYFDQLPYGNYLMYSPEIFIYDNVETYNIGFMLSSNRMQISSRGGIAGLSEDVSSYLDSFCFGDNKDIAGVYSYIEDYGIDYMLLTSKENVESLETYGAKLVLTIENVSSNYYLLKI